jgi:hypothetical protein
MDKPKFAEKLDRWVTGITAIPVLGFFIKEAWEKFIPTMTEKGAKKLQERFERFVGLNTEDAQRSLKDEFIYSLAVADFKIPEQDEIDNFEIRLRDDDEEKAEAFVLFIAQKISEFVFETKKTTQPLAKGQPSISETFTNYDKGVVSAKVFLEAMLRRRGSSDNETFQLRVAYLKGKNVFSLINPKKGDSPLKVSFEKAKKAVTAGAGSVDLTRGVRSLSDRIKRM